MSVANNIKDSFFAISAFLVIISSAAIINFSTVSASSQDGTADTSGFEYNPSVVAYPAVDYSTVPGVYTKDDGTHVQYIEFPPLHIVIPDLNK